MLLMPWWGWLVLVYVLGAIIPSIVAWWYLGRCAGMDDREEEEL